MSSFDGPLLGLGAAQFGMPYGLSRPQHSVEGDEVGRILNAAWASGVDLIDTAAAYGDSEEVIGCRVPPLARFSIVTKVVPLRVNEIGPAEVARAISRFHASLAALRVGRIEALLVHEARDLLVPGGELLFSALQELRDQGTVRRLGVSVYDPEILEQVRARYPIEVVQLPLNVFDQRFSREGCIASLARQGVEVHVRSVYLKGLLLRHVEEVPNRLAAASEAIARFHDAARDAGLEPASAALAFAAGQSGVNRIVVGVDSLAMFEANSRAWAAAKDWRGTIDFDSLALNEPLVTDPRRWSD